MGKQIEQRCLFERALAAAVGLQQPRPPYRLAGLPVGGVELDLLDRPADAVIGDVGRQLAVALQGLDGRLDHSGDRAAEGVQTRLHGGGPCRTGTEVQDRSEVGGGHVVVGRARSPPAGQVLPSGLLGRHLAASATLLRSTTVSYLLRAMVTGARPGRQGRRSCLRGKSARVGRSRSSSGLPAGGRGDLDLRRRPFGLSCPRPASSGRGRSVRRAPRVRGRPA